MNGAGTWHPSSRKSCPRAPLPLPRCPLFSSRDSYLGPTQRMDLSGRYPRQAWSITPDSTIMAYDVWWQSPALGSVGPQRGFLPRYQAGMREGVRQSPEAGGVCACVWCVPWSCGCPQGPPPNKCLTPPLLPSLPQGQCGDYPHRVSEPRKLIHPWGTAPSLASSSLQSLGPGAQRPSALSRQSSAVMGAVRLAGPRGCAW